MRGGFTSPAVVVVAHCDAERLGRVEVELLVTAVEESGGGGADGLEGQVGRTGTCRGFSAAVMPDSHSTGCHTGVIVADVKTILVAVTVANDAGFEVVAAGWGDCRAGCTGRRGRRKSKRHRDWEERRNRGDCGTHCDVADHSGRDQRQWVCKKEWQNEVTDDTIPYW